ncbi:hypothetical protein [Luteibacter sp. dw_328]|uniref:hypothetical protein n=1 Tax=Luteibacter sp. dw_328 TaxID=2719796 RepID=UPI001BD586FA|nr:hypothetical protein [Luteibacter sp. dw_328]
MRILDVDVSILVKWRDVRASQSPTQFNLERTNLLGAFKIAIERGMVTSNPAANLKRAVTRPRDQ